MKTYLITGATGGLGLELVKTALNDGHRVIAAVRNPDALAELVQAYPNQLQTERFNTADTAQFQTLAAKSGQRKARHTTAAPLSAKCATTFKTTAKTASPATPSKSPAP